MTSGKSTYQLPIVLEAMNVLCMDVRTSTGGGCADAVHVTDSVPKSFNIIGKDSRRKELVRSTLHEQPVKQRVLLLRSRWLRGVRVASVPTVIHRSQLMRTLVRSTAPVSVANDINVRLLVFVDAFSLLPKNVWCVGSPGDVHGTRGG